jgi:hypothetical protein
MIIYGIYDIAKFVQQLCLKECDCPGGTLGVLLVLILYCQHITILTAYTNISLVLSEIGNLFLEYILYFVSNKSVAECL